jgi:hypothetical protein
VNNRTQLASGDILNGAILSIWLVQPADDPESVVVMWPQRPTGNISPPLFGAGSDSVPIGRKCQHRSSPTTFRRHGPG